MDTFCSASLYHGCIDGLVQDCSISSGLAMEILQSCTEPLIWSYDFLNPFPSLGIFNYCHSASDVTLKDMGQNNLMKPPQNFIEAKWHIYVSINQDIITLDNGLSPVQHQVIILPTAGLLSSGHLWTNFSDFIISKYKKKIKLKTNQWDMNQCHINYFIRLTFKHTICNSSTLQCNLRD